MRVMKVEKSEFELTGPDTLTKTLSSSEAKGRALASTERFCNVSFMPLVATRQFKVKLNAMMPD